MRRVLSDCVEAHAGFDDESELVDEVRKLHVDLFGATRRSLAEQRTREQEPAGGVVVQVHLVLHEDEVPELDDAVGVIARPVLVAAELWPAVVVELGARARAGRPACQKLSSRPSRRSARPDADRRAARDRLLLGAEPRAPRRRRDVIQMRSKSRPKPSVESSVQRAGTAPCLK